MFKLIPQLLIFYYFVCQSNHWLIWVSSKLLILTKKFTAWSKFLYRSRWRWSCYLGQNFFLCYYRFNTNKYSVQIIFSFCYRSSGFVLLIIRAQIRPALLSIALKTFAIESYHLWNVPKRSIRIKGQKARGH